MRRYWKPSAPPSSPSTHPYPPHPLLTLLPSPRSLLQVWKGDMWSNLIYQRGPKTVRDMFTIKVEAIKKWAMQ